MSQKLLPAALLLALLPLAALAEEPAPVAAAPAIEAPAPDLAAAPAVAAETPTAELPAVSDTSAQSPLGASPTPPTGKRACNMKKGMMGGQGVAMDMGPGKMCGRPGHKGCGCGYGGGHGAMHQDVVERLDLMEARLAKIEALLESLVRR